MRSKQGTLLSQSYLLPRCINLSPWAQPKLQLRVRNERSTAAAPRTALCTSAHRCLSPINRTIWSWGATWNTGRSSRREGLCRFFCHAFCQNFHGQAGSGASWVFLFCSVWGRGGREEVAGWRLEPTASCEAGGPEPPGGAGGGQGGIPPPTNDPGHQNQENQTTYTRLLEDSSEITESQAWGWIGKARSKKPPWRSFRGCGAECCWPAGAQTQHCRRNPGVRPALATSRQVDALKLCTWTTSRILTLWPAERRYEAKACEEWGQIILLTRLTSQGIRRKVRWRYSTKVSFPGDKVGLSWSWDRWPEPQSPGFLQDLEAGKANTITDHSNLWQNQFIGKYFNEVHLRIQRKFFWFTIQKHSRLGRPLRLIFRRLASSSDTIIDESFRWPQLPKKFLDDSMDSERRQVLWATLYAKWAKVLSRGCPENMPCKAIVASNTLLWRLCSSTAYTMYSYIGLLPILS